MRYSLPIMAFLVLVLLGIAAVASQPSSPSQTPGTMAATTWTISNINDEKLWSSQPVLNDLVYDSAVSEQFAVSAHLGPLQITALKLLGENVLLKYLLLDAEARPITSNMTLSTSRKAELFAQMHYNDRILEIVNTADARARSMLSAEQYAGLVRWAQDRYASAERAAQEYAHRPPPNATSAPTIQLPKVDQGNLPPH